MKLKIAIPKAPPAPTELPSEVQSEVTVIRNHYPKIGERIALMWGSAELQKYLNNLVYDERGDREGFPRPIANAIMRVLREHGKLVLEEERNPWNTTSH